MMKNWENNGTGEMGLVTPTSAPDDAIKNSQLTKGISWRSF